MMLKGVSSQHLLPDIRLPVTRPILHQMCDAFFFVIKDRYMVSLYRSMLTLAFNGLLRPGEFTYSPHVIRVENVYLQDDNITLLFPSTKAHSKPFPQKVEVHPCQQHCPVQYLKSYLHLRPPGPGALFIMTMAYQFSTHRYWHCLNSWPSSSTSPHSVTNNIQSALARGWNSTSSASATS